jgi:hypothetical protein
VVEWQLIFSLIGSWLRKKRLRRIRMKVESLSLGDKVRARAFITSEKWYKVSSCPADAEVFQDSAGEGHTARRVLLRWPKAVELGQFVYTVVGLKRFQTGYTCYLGEEEGYAWEGTGAQTVVCLRRGMSPTEKVRYALAGDLEVVKPSVMVQIEQQLSKLEGFKAAFQKEFGENTE